MQLSSRNWRLWRWVALVCSALGAVALAQAAPDTSGPTISTRRSPVLAVDGRAFKDLNKDGALNPYEDWRLPVEERIADLLSRMTSEEKAAQMAHFTLYNPREAWFSTVNVGFALAYTQLMESPRAAAEWSNQIQEWSEASRLGIPVIISMDSVMGASWVRGATLFPDQIGLAATGDVQLVRELADMQRREMLAMGVRMSLSPIADLGTEPRWGRFQETFGESAELASAMVAAAVDGLQAGTTIGASSILACVKHFPGSGPQTDGKDGSPLVFTNESLDVHLAPFRAAIEAGAQAIMPYGYSVVPYLGGDAVTRPAHESSAVMTDLLRGVLGFGGLIQTDWGLKHADAALAGADVLGGAGQRDIPKVAAALTAERLDQSVRRILEIKFAMGLFENPYVDPAAAEQLIGTAESRELARRAAAESLTLVKLGEALPVRDGARVLVAGALADDVEALNSGWKCPGQVGTSILEEIRSRAAVTTFAENASALTPDLLDGVDVAVIVLGEKSYTHDPEWVTGTLEVSQEQTDLLEALDAANVPTIGVALVGRPYVLTEALSLVDTLLIVYRPGVTQGAVAVADALFGRAAIDGRLPFQLPRTAEQVLEQREDLPGDFGDPLFDRGFGLTYSPIPGESAEAAD